MAHDSPRPSRKRTTVLPATLVAALAGLAALLLLSARAEGAGSLEVNVILSLDTLGDVGRYTSLALDASGNPVVSYYDASNGDLKLLRCSNPACASYSLGSPDMTGDVGQYTSLALDANGHPVVSYYDATNGDLKVLHCDDAACSSSTITSPDTAYNVGQYTSLALDAAGRPVVSYYRSYGSSGSLVLLHCGDPTCSAGNTTVVVDAYGNAGGYPSLVLDASGNPIISYHRFEVTGSGCCIANTGELRIVHCDDPDCTGPESIQIPDTSFTGRGPFNSLALDSGGNPVIAYARDVYHWQLFCSGEVCFDLPVAPDIDLEMLRCNDANCAAAADFVSPDVAGNVGLWPSLVLAAGTIQSWPIMITAAAT